jgi:hypothetical protein
MFRYRFGQFIESDFFDAIGSSVAVFDRFTGSLFDFFSPGITTWMQHKFGIGGFLQPL